ncbi:MAG: glutamine synthetase beta-grasp domain-containing protein [Rickettsiales bacterium]|nr:glutamine synthetase beta-grasp domain-containing protein [Rickettsiales bacterium]
MTTNLKLAEYIWLDGAIPTRQMRSKSKVVNLSDDPSIDEFLEWSFDGSSTNQADGEDSDCILKPVNFVKDPIRVNGGFLVICEVLNPDGTPHITNSRAQLRDILDAGAAKSNPWIGFEQEYTLFSKETRTPLGWPQNGYPAAQGPYYCGVGADEVFGRELAEAHAEACIEAGILYYGMNAEVMPGQWEFQIGYRGVDAEDTGVLQVTDHTWLARFLLKRIAEDFNIAVSFENKPIKGDWNGAGMHTNFSTDETRAQATGKAAIENAIKALSSKHNEHIALYGDKLDERLTGLHETACISQFSSGVADRGSSIRIPKPVEIKGYGYFEDRRPGANSDPYLVAARLSATVCGIDESIMQFNSWPREASFSQIEEAKAA